MIARRVFIWTFYWLGVGLIAYGLPGYRALATGVGCVLFHLVYAQTTRED